MTTSDAVVGAPAREFELTVRLYRDIVRQMSPRYRGLFGQGDVILVHGYSERRNLIMPWLVMGGLFFWMGSEPVEDQSFGNLPPVTYAMDAYENMLPLDVFEWRYGVNYQKTTAFALREALDLVDSVGFCPW